ncbi:MAG: zinc-ribbon domain-containing protein, partial [Actinomycetota bacterium]
PAPTPAPGTPPPPPPAQAGAVVPPVIPAARDKERICPNCSSVNSGESQFCTNCGTRLEA